MCACSTKEMYLVQRAVKAADPKSFIVVLESDEVHGEGFRMMQIENDRQDGYANEAMSFSRNAQFIRIPAP